LRFQGQLLLVAVCAFINLPLQSKQVAIIERVTIAHSQTVQKYTV